MFSKTTSVSFYVHVAMLLLIAFVEKSLSIKVHRVTDPPF